MSIELCEAFVDRGHSEARYKQRVGLFSDLAEATNKNWPTLHGECILGPFKVRPSCPSRLEVCSIMPQAPVISVYYYS